MDTNSLYKDEILKVTTETNNFFTLKFSEKLVHLFQSKAQGKVLFFPSHSAFLPISQPS